jgi:hypothetical protein
MTPSGSRLEAELTHLVIGVLGRQMSRFPRYGFVTTRFGASGRR